MTPGWIAQHMTTTASKRKQTGNGAYGPVYSDPVSFRCYAERGTKMVRATATGEDAESTTRLWAFADEVEALFTAADGSLDASGEVTESGRVSRVLSVTIHDPGALPLPRMVEVAL